MTRRINAVFPHEDWLTLERLAAAHGKTKTQILRDAIALEKWYWGVRAEGGTIFVEMNDGSIKEIVPR